jgi:anti-sigma regulatory factor (Ser/Thr protein kinase)
MNAKDADVHMSLLSQPRLLASVRSLVTTLAERIGFGEVESGHIALAVDEALANIIRHGYEQRENELIEIFVWILKTPKQGIRIMIEDEAPQVDPDSIQGRDLENVRPGGLGVHIMREVMSTCHFERRENKGMRVIMEKTLEGNPPDTSTIAGSRRESETG